MKKLKHPEYETKKEALKAKICYCCEEKMNGALVVLTLHITTKEGKLKKKNHPLCSQECLMILTQIIQESQGSKIPFPDDKIFCSCCGTSKNHL